MVKFKVLQNKQQKSYGKLLLLLLLSGSILLSIGLGLLFSNHKGRALWEKITGISLPFDESIEGEKSNGNSEVLRLVSLPALERESKLREIAATENPSLERSRARYVLANDLIAKFEGGQAIRQLERLEKYYPRLGAYVLLKRARAYELSNEKSEARKTWEKLVEDYPDSPVIPEALYKLGSFEPKYWEEALAKYPTHPRTHQLIGELLDKNPQQTNLMLLLAKYNPDGERTKKIREKLVNDYSDQLTPEHWEIIAKGYWQQKQYGQAANAYAKATPTAENLYRAARALDVSDEKEKAKIAYEKLFTTFPDANETGLGLRRFAALVDNSEAIGYLNRVIDKFPEQGAKAAMEKAEIQKKSGDGAGANQTGQVLLTKFPQSLEAAKYRWQQAERLNKAGQSQQAWEVAKPILTNNPDTNYAPEAGFWIGKWALKAGKQDEAQAAFKYVIQKYPQSYYAWRSAVMLGWDVGNFNTVRQIQPKIEKPQGRLVPPVGSEIFKELYLLGQDEDAEILLASAMGGREATVNEQFTQGLLLLSKDKYLDALDRIWTLKERESEADKQQWLALRQTPVYWQALFPFPYEEQIIKWSQERQINPLLVVSLMRQESRFNPKITSSVGATGLMQIMPDTAKWIAEQTKLEEYSLTNPEDNIHMGTWYLAHTHEVYNNSSLLAIASYNAGPGNINQWVGKYDLSDPDMFVEQIPFPETKGYVESVLGNYWNYLRIYDADIARKISAIQ